MDTETLKVLQKGEDFEIIVQHDQTGSACGITLSKNAYEQLRQHFVSGRSEQLCRTFLSDGTTSSATKCRFCGKEKWEH